MHFKENSENTNNIVSSMDKSYIVREAYTEMNCDLNKIKEIL